MKSILQSFPLLLRNLLSIFRKRWNRSTRRLWYILGFLRSRSSPRHPKKEDDTRRCTESRPTKPNSTTVICASRLPLSGPPPLTPIIGGETPVIASPTPISIEVRQPTILSPRHTFDEPNEENGTDHLNVDVSFLEGSAPFSRPPHFAASYHDEPDAISAVLPQGQELAQNSFTFHSQTDSRSSSRSSNHPAPQHVEHHPGYYPEIQHLHRPRSESSCRSSPGPNNAEVAARGYLPAPPHPEPPLPTQSRRPPSIAPSVSSRVYRASRPNTPVPRPSPITVAPGRKTRPPTPTPARQDVHEAPIDASAVDTGLPSASFEDNLRPMVSIDRYEKHKAVKVETMDDDHVLPPVTTEFVRNSAPKDWIPLVHPEGALYWVHEKAPIYTDTNMRDSCLRQRIGEALKEIDELKKSFSDFPADDDWELALELAEETDKHICRYYFVRHSTRCLFWLHEFNPDGAMGNLSGVTEQTHIHLALEAQYWLHWEMHPHDRKVPEYLHQELLGILAHAGIDCMTSRNSTSAYPEEELSKLLGYVNYVTLVGGRSGFSACMVGRLMGSLVYSRFINFYGQKGARLANDQTIYGNKPKRTYLIKTLSVLFFYTPEIYLGGLESVYTDFVLCRHRWARFIAQVQDEWGSIILNGTVLLNANVAFLAIPSVDPGNHIRTPSQVASYFSTITSIGSVVIGLLLVRKHRNKPHDFADEVDGYLRHRHSVALGFETLAILYSLPYSLLMWSTVAFTTAFGLEALVLSRQMWTKLSVGAILVIITALIFWCILTTVETGTDFSVVGGAYRLKDCVIGFASGLGSSIVKPRFCTGNDEDETSRGSGTWGWPFTIRRRRPSLARTLVNSNQTGGSPSRGSSGSKELGLVEVKGVQEGAAQDVHIV